GVYVERSAELVVGVLGIWEAGGAYVPLDGSYPAERVEYMLEDAQVAVLVSEQGRVEKLRGYWGVVVCLDTDWERVGEGEGVERGVLGGEEGRVERLRGCWGVVVCLDTDWEQVEQVEGGERRAGARGEGEAEAEVEGERNGSNLAYVIYTSGSTGRPKGV